MGKIVQLNEHLSNMIAAGEVVEKTSSVVKELVENSIDAQSKKIIINLVDSGIKKIQVIDDGQGMSKEDATMAFFRHATSKIKNEYDLSRIQTLGFRGEAIPSIASVSKMTLLTNNGSGGFEVSYKAGIKISSIDAPSNIGTTITVEDLFYNTPARLKYLKSLPQELSSITYLIQKFALSMPNISFTLTNNQRTILSTSGNGDLKRLFGEIYGLETAKNLIISEYENFGYKLKVALVKPVISRANKNEITAIVNNRYVKNMSLTQPVVDAYLTYVPLGRYPICLIYLDIDPLLIDVNVHPSKTIIKISNEDELKAIITSIIKDALTKIDNIPNIKHEEVKNTSYVKDDIFSFQEETIKYESPKYDENIKNFDEDNTKTENISFKYEPNKEIEEPIISNDIPVSPRLPYLEYVGQVHGTYLIFQNDEGMYLVDQHAAAERINYEKYYDLLKNPTSLGIPLLIPYNLDFTRDEMIFIDEHLEEFNKLGFSLEQSGSNSYFVREIPSWVDFDNIEMFIQNLINSFFKDKSVNIIKNRDFIAKQIACKSSIKANKFINQDEASLLMNTLSKCNNPYTCPHGRPSIIKMTNLELEKLFKRVI